MKIDKLEEKIPIPEGLTFAYVQGICKVTGPKGEVEKTNTNFEHHTVLITCLK